jgi:hypothetical protein
LFSVLEKYDPKRKISELINFLRDRNKAAIVFFNSSKAVGILVPASERECKNMNAPRGFRAIVAHLGNAMTF